MNRHAENVAFVVALCAGLLLAASPGHAAGVSVDKGNFQYSEPSPWPDITLDLGPIERQVASQASERCGTPLAASPLDLGDAEGFMAKMAGKAASAAVGKVLGGLLGGGGSSSKKPKMLRDPIKKKLKSSVEHADGKTRLLIGGGQSEEGLLLSARIDKARGKGTFHTMFLELPDCTRIWPEQYLQYGLWGSWSLSVSVTKTTTNYRNGKQVGEATSTTDSWSRSGKFDVSRGFSLWDQLDDQARLVLDPDAAYLNQLRSEIGEPAWQQMGYARPVDGIRAAGGLFPVRASELPAGTIAVVHVTHLRNKRYTTLAVPVQLSANGEQGVSLAALGP